jgi:hypothetical protein
MTGGDGELPVAGERPPGDKVGAAQPHTAKPLHRKLPQLVNNHGGQES